MGESTLRSRWEQQLIAMRSHPLRAFGRLGRLRQIYGRVDAYLLRRYAPYELPAREVEPPQRALVNRRSAGTGRPPKPLALIRALLKTVSRDRTTDVPPGPQVSGLEAGDFLRIAWVRRGSAVQDLASRLDQAQIPCQLIPDHEGTAVRVPLGQFERARRIVAGVPAASFARRVVTARSSSIAFLGLLVLILHFYFLLAVLGALARNAAAGWNTHSFLVCAIFGIGWMATSLWLLGRMHVLQLLRKSRRVDCDADRPQG